MDTSWGDGAPRNEAGDGVEDVLSRVLRHAWQRPEAPAVSDGRRRLTFGELADETARLAAGLSSREVGAGDRVVLVLANSVDFVVGALACMWLGATWVPVDIDDPPERRLSILADCEPRLVLTASQDQPEALPGHVTLVDAMGGSTSRAPDPLTDASLSAYAIYTSGTTGAPKGVMIPRSAFAHGVASAVEALGLDATSRGMCVSAFHFDGSYGGLFPPLYAGGSVVIPLRDSLLFPRVFVRTVEREGVTSSTFSPSYLRLLLGSSDLDRLATTTLRVISLGGEACSASDVRELLAAVPQLRVFNQYGPTETTIAVTHFEIAQNSLQSGEFVPIGVPHRGVRFYLLDEHGDVVEESGRPGRLCIGGSQLMSGYWHAPGLTAEVLRDDVVPGDRVFLTDDLAVRDDAGCYRFIARMGGYVKRNSVRISLVELAETLRGLDDVSDAVCAAYQGEGATTCIAAFVVTDPATTIANVRNRACDRIPQSMVPDVFHGASRLPLKPSGKIDVDVLLTSIGLTGIHPQDVSQVGA
ncbi:amino acid adenylation domain-containing protein [Flexivirga alba]|uniref:Amino acid adenylation domain-containing protein n=1 Tax=Flexivirga alba TaxID=702742 RepID=A0ABW2AG28_9MICO